MARIPYANTDELPQAVAQLLDDLPDLNVLRMMAHAQTAFTGVIDCGAALLGRIELPAGLRELAILPTARCSGFDYEWRQHADAARAVGISAEQIDALSRGVTTLAHFSAAEQSTLAVTECLVMTDDIPDDVFEAARLRFPPRQLVELVLVIGYYRMLGGLLRGLRVDLDVSRGSSLLRYSAEH